MSIGHQQPAARRPADKPQESSIMTQVIAETNERQAVYVPLGESKPITLTVGIAKRFLVVPTRSGKYPTEEQITKYIMLCQAQGLNPWVGDAYLVGYDGKDGPTFSLITAHQAFLKRAEASKEYDGMESGVVVRQCERIDDREVRAIGDPVYREGDLVLDDEMLIGGWARVHRKDRGKPSYDALKLSTFHTGLSRWNKDPAGMITKCAEASALRKAFPSNLAGLYCQEEMEHVLDRAIDETQRRTAGNGNGRKSSGLNAQLHGLDPQRISHQTSDSDGTVEVPPEIEQPEHPDESEVPQQTVQDLEWVTALGEELAECETVSQVSRVSQDYAGCDQSIAGPMIARRRGELTPKARGKAAGGLPGMETGGNYT